MESARSLAIRWNWLSNEVALALSDLPSACLRPLISPSLPLLLQVGGGHSSQYEQHGGQRKAGSSSSSSSDAGRVRDSVGISTGVPAG
jgi:hypothetical protein